MKCATCNADLNVEVCGHIAHDPRLTPEAQLTILRQSLFQQPAKPQPPTEQTKS